nr:amorphane sesquiterpene synthase [Mycoleptodiscus sp.]
MASPLQSRSITFQAYTLWLFNKSDLKTVLLPQSLFAFSSAFTGGFSGNVPPDNQVLPASMIKSMFWIWVALLVQSIANQRLPNSVVEDSLNKPWRPLPAKRITRQQADHILHFVLPFVAIYSLYVGSFKELATLVIFIWIYNDLGGADQSVLYRNVLNAFGLMSFSSGVTAITAGSDWISQSTQAPLWVAVTGLIIASTVHAQDLEDMEGDIARGRKTVPLIYGENIARGTLAVAVTFWSIYCPAFWNLGFIGFLPTTLLGFSAAFRTLSFRTQISDQRTWALICVWYGVIYLLPVVHALLN